MPTSRAYVAKPVPASPYRVDGRATINVPLKPYSTNVDDGVTRLVTSGVRVGTDTWDGGAPSGY